VLFAAPHESAHGPKFAAAQQGACNGDEADGRRMRRTQPCLTLRPCSKPPITAPLCYVLTRMRVPEDFARPPRRGSPPDLKQ
jgi:hypothetical protein